MNTFISGGKDSKEMRHLQKIQGVAMKNSYAEKKLQERYKNVEEFADQLNLTKTTRVSQIIMMIIERTGRSERRIRRNPLLRVRCALFPALLAVCFVSCFARFTYFLMHHTTR